MRCKARKQLGCLCLHTSFNWNLSHVAAPTREIVIITEKKPARLGKLKNHYAEAFCMPGFLFITVIIYLRRFFNRTPHAVSLRSAPSQLQSIMGIVRGFPHSIKNTYICSFPRSIEGNMCVHSTYLARFVTRLKVETKWHFNMPHEAVGFSLMHLSGRFRYRVGGHTLNSVQLSSGVHLAF